MPTYTQNELADVCQGASYVAVDSATTYYNFGVFEDYNGLDITAANSGNTVYGKIQGTWERVRGTKTSGDGDDVNTPTLWSLKEDIEALDAKAEAAHTKVNAKTPGTGEHITVAVVEQTDSTTGAKYDEVTITESDIASAAYVGTFTALDGETTVVAHAEKYTDSAVTALDNSFVAITTSEITALFT
jgi:hypothetical protein